MRASRRLFYLLLISLPAYIAFFWLFPRFNTSASWKQEIDRKGAIARGREVAQQFGFNLNGATQSVEAELNRNVEFYLQTYPDGKFSSLLTPVVSVVRFFNFRERRNFKASFDSKGRLLGVDQRQRSLTGPSKADKQTPRVQTEADRGRAIEIADRALDDLIGDRRSVFTGAPTISDEREGLRVSWVETDEQLRVIAEATVADGKAVNIMVSTAPTSRFRGMMEARQSSTVKLLGVVDGLIIWPSLIAVIIAYFIGIARRQINHRRTLRLFLLCLCISVFITLAGGLVDDFRSGNIQFNGKAPPPFIDAAAPIVLFILSNLAVAGGLYFLYAAGSSLYNEHSGLRALDLALILKGKLRTIPVVQSFVVGLAAGGLRCAIPYLAAASHLFPQMTFSGNNLEDSFASSAPALTSFLSTGFYPVFLVFAFVAPLIAAFVPQALYEKLLLFLCVWLIVVGASPSISLSAVLITTLFSALLLTWVYRQFGLLSVLIAVMASQAALTAASLIVQPNRLLQISGWRVIGGLAVFMAIGVIGLFKARPVRPDEIAEDMKGLETRAERDRLKAEFDVAARAQQHMLPGAPPDLPGIDITAVCLPSREVGGDLYDFLSLPGGKVGIVVADVSGKGVPASLYMTLTKGLLDSISEDTYDPGEILREVNRRLYEVCKRKMFVTLFLGVIDPKSRTLDYARAGHNPTVFRRPSGQQTTLLKSRGMGLGLNSGQLFDQSLKVESLRLEAGDKLFFYSDGITEAMNRKNEEYGEDRLMAMAAATDALNVIEARDAILKDVNLFLGEVPPQDDQTLIVVEVTS